MLTGGLGIACYGLSKALSEHADLTVIVPRSDPEFKINQFNLIGLNHIRLEDVSRGRAENDYHQFAAVHEISADLDPYPDAELQAFYPGMIKPASSKQTRIQTPVVLRASEAEALFSDIDVYGPNIMRKVAAYTEVVCKLAMTLEFDLIHAHDWITYAAAIKLKQLTGKPMIVHVHSLETDRVDSSARNTVYNIELNGMLAADRVLPVSNFTRQNIIEHYGIDSNKLTTVYNGIAPVTAYKTEKPLKVATAINRAEFTDKGRTPVAESVGSDIAPEPEYVYRSREAIKPMALRIPDMANSVIDNKGPVDKQEMRLSNSALLADGSLGIAGRNAEADSDISNQKFENYSGAASLQKAVFQNELPEKWVVFLGRVTRQKSPFMMLETARKLVKKMKNVRFFVAGTGDQLGILKQAVENEGLQDYFVFTGFISKAEVGLLLSRADVYFMPSISEPFGLSAVEAAQFDVPCVISKQSGVAELLTHALKANFWDTDKFSDLLYAVLNFDGIKETIVSHTRTDLANINWHIAAKTVSEIYTELIN